MEILCKLLINIVFCVLGFVTIQEAIIDKNSKHRFFQRIWKIEIGLAIFIIVWGFGVWFVQGEIL